MRIVYVMFGAALLVAGTAQAQPEHRQPGWFFQPYVGGDYQYNMYESNNMGGGVQSEDIIELDLHGGNVHAGARVHKNLGFEVGYGLTQEGSQNFDGGLLDPLDAGINVRSKTSGYSVTFDVMGYTPMTENLELIGTAGLAYTDMEVKMSALGVTVTDDESEWQPRLGFGAQYWLADNVNARGLVRYQWADFKDVVDDGMIVSAGVNVQF